LRDKKKDWGNGRLGDREIGRLEIGDWRLEIGDWEIGRLEDWKIGWTLILIIDPSKLT
jgi:hypothetical protein